MQARTPLSLTLLSLLTACQPTPSPKAAAMADPDTELLARGEFLVKVGGCNDCHTPGYAPAGGKLPKEQWLTGSPQGFMGPWGTTYASNLRVNLSKMSEDEWLVYSSTFHTRPPMPDFMVRELPEEDRRALHRFITSLGAAGTEAPSYLPPGQQPAPPYFHLILPTPPVGSETPADSPPKAAPAS